MQLTGIEKRFGAVEVLHRADLMVGRGEIVGLCGEAGAGKSTLVKILAGVHPWGTYAGGFRIDGAERHLRGPADAHDAGIAVVHQHPMLVPQLSVAHNLMLGREPRRYGLVDGARLESEARAQLARYGFADQISTSSVVGDLELGLQQIVEIVRALSQEARLLILDEPAAFLQTHERERLYGWLRTLKQRGTTTLYVSNRIDDVIGLCDRVTVLRGGRTAQTLRGAPSHQRGMRGRYEVHDEIAAGGMATVHLGKRLGPFGFTSTVAIKRLLPQLAKDPEFVAMFLDEARLASRVRHPNVVPVLDVFAEEGQLSLVMEYVDGESLASLCRIAEKRREPIPLPVAAGIVASVLDGLHAAHEAHDEQGRPLGLVHRDVSPQNVIVGSDGVVRVIDFGIAKAAGRCNVSRDGQLKGKLSYMAPEQIQRGIVNRRTDVYGASVLLWELLTGERLFDGEGEGMIIGRVLDDIVPPPSSLRPEVSSLLDEVTLRGLDRAQSRRFESAREMARRLELTIAPATPAEIGEWVNRLAERSIEARRCMLARLEQAEAARDEMAVPEPAPELADAPLLLRSLPRRLLAGMVSIAGALGFLGDGK